MCSNGDICAMKQAHIAKIENQNNMLKRELTKAKVALRKVVDYLGQFCSDYPDCVIEAEQFLKEIEEK